MSDTYAVYAGKRGAIRFINNYTELKEAVERAKKEDCGSVLNESNGNTVFLSQEAIENGQR